MHIPIISGEQFMAEALEHDRRQKAELELFKQKVFLSHKERQKLPGKNISYDKVIIQDAIVKDLQLRCHLNVCIVRNTQFINCNLSGAWLSGTVFQNCIFQNCHFVKTDMPSAFFIGCDLSGSRFRKTDMIWTDFRFANLTGCTFSSVRLIEIDFRHANFTDCVFEYSLIAECKLYNTSQQQAKSLGDLGVRDVSIDVNGSEMIHSDLESIKAFLTEKPAVS